MLFDCVSIVFWDNYCRSSRPNQTRTLTFSWASKFACKYIVYLVFLDYSDYLDYLSYIDYLDYLDYLFNFDCRCKSDFKGGKDVPLIGQGFQNIMDSYFWYLQFAIFRQCKYVMDRAKIQKDEWRTKREDLADEHKMTGARESLRAGLKAWLASEAQRKMRCFAEEHQDDCCGG
jgi:hypothetical protein